MAGDSGDLRAIDTQVGRFELLDAGIIFWEVSFAARLDEHSAAEAASAAQKLAPGKPIVIIADARGLGFADRKARGIFADADIQGRIATGVIVSNRVIRYLAEQYARQTEGMRPFEIFSAKSDAIDWANEQLRRVRQDP